jgi:alkanesulfonate monooxygenase SsuD/methylene tetrahydromethanopterin reductase-like flavin-dependent oxidoreductase (luciferase family)
LGVGSGWFEKDFDEYQYPFGTSGGRIDAMELALERITSRLARLQPPPTRKIPVLIGGTGLRRTLRLVAEYADGWHALFPGTADELREPLAALQRHCADVGRSIDEIEMGLGVEPEDVDQFLAEQAPTLLEMGFTQFTLGFNGPDWNVAAGERWLAWRDEVNASL